jgi:molybdopterin-binding protein
MKLSARNVLKGKVLQIVSIITNSSVKSLGLKKGGEAYAVIKASNVMVAVD